MEKLATLDWIVICAYFLVLAALALWVISKKTENTEDYFLAGRNIGWFVIGSSIFASNIGSEHVVGLAGTGAAGKFPLIIYELHAWVVLLLGWVFLPFYARSGVFTMPEFLERRFDTRSRNFLSIISLVAYILTKVSVTIYAGGIVVAALLDIEFWTGALATVILTGIYTVFGGMRAVVYTETLQTIVLIFGAATLTYMGLDAVGGWSSMKAELGPQFFNMWRSASDPDFPWPSLFLTSTIVGIWYWCTDQYIVQRALTAANIKEGRRGTIFGALLKLMPVFLFLIPGVIALTLKQRGLIHWDTPDEAFAVLLTSILPHGLRGLVAAGLLAALMSSLASVFNSCSTLYTIDIYKKNHPDAPEKQLVKIGQYATIIIVIAGIAWIPIMANISGVLYEYLQSVQAYISPPITAIFLLGIFVPRITSTGAISTLVTGFSLGMIRIVFELLAKNGSIGSDNIFYNFGSMNFLHFGVISFIICLGTAIIVSLLGPKPELTHVQGLTLQTMTPEQKAHNKNSYNYVDILASLFVLALVISIMIYFNGK
ncbi:MAG: sodium/solute symporter [Saprospiraceae bacterium]|jgi:SSS family solute:Na+ symporter|nr:sodium/solute symporter [Saprospiraceae bacterium]MBL0023866.1 sodium/solute symporter [Saprospiraceae bacterium]